MLCTANNGGEDLKIIPFSELYRMDYSVIHLLVMEQFWKEEDLYITPKGGREESGLIYFRDCDTQYALTEHSKGERQFQVARGGVCYLPHGAEYRCRFCHVDAKGYATAILVNFSLVDENGQLFRLKEQAGEIPLQNAARCRGQLEQLLALSQTGRTPPARIKASLLDMLTDLSLELHQERLTGRRFASIAPGILYLEQHFTDSISVPVLAQQCHVSEASFRRLFKAYAGMTPVEYLHKLRMERAQFYLESGTMTVGEIAAAVGIEDAAYFSRLFKKRMGIPPSAVVKRW